MTKKVVVHYAAWSDINYRGDVELFEIEDDDELTEKQLDDIAIGYILEDISAWAEVVDDESPRIN